MLALLEAVVRIWFVMAIVMWYVQYASRIVNGKFSSHKLFLQPVETPTAPLASDVLVIVESIWGFGPFNFSFLKSQIYALMDAWHRSAHCSITCRVEEK